MTQRRILVIEDDPMFRHLFHEVFDRPGYALRLAGSMGEAMQVLASWRPHVVVTDLHLPDAEGPVVIRQLRRHAGAMLIAMSGDMDPAYVAALRSAGALGCIDKERAFDGELSLLLSQV